MDKRIQRRTNRRRLNAGQAEADARRWYDENRNAVDAYNEMIECAGYVFSDGVRTF
jgi:post-segregation antitoxin (ccd killing protein)